MDVLRTRGTTVRLFPRISPILVDDIYLEFKAAKTAIVGVMTTSPGLTCQFRVTVTPYRHFAVIDYLSKRDRNGICSFQVLVFEHEYRVKGILNRFLIDS